MDVNIYEQLREQLDQYSVGFPKTKSGVEMKILKRLFTEEEAQMFLNLSLIGETSSAVAKRMKQGHEYMAELLERMTKKGLLFRLRKKESTLYSAIPFVVGIYEFQLNAMDKELAGLMEQYLEEGFTDNIAGQDPPLRPIAVNRSIDVSWPVAPYEDVRKMIMNQKEVAVANCICRLEKGLLNDACDKPLEVCLSFGVQARYYVDLGMARWITQEEALEIMDLCDESGLVPQPTNSQNPIAICNCCGDCCGVLRSLRKHPRPADMVLSNYYAEVDPDLCSACETCLERCQMDAITMGEDDTAVINLERCIGCGLCVTTCTTEALKLQTKPAEERRKPPDKFKDAMLEMAQKRGTSLIPFAFRQAS